MQKTIFITGASAGLGKAAAKFFQSKGWKVIATMRNPEKEMELALLDNVTIMKMWRSEFFHISSSRQAIFSPYHTTQIILHQQ